MSVSYKGFVTCSLIALTAFSSSYAEEAEHGVSPIPTEVTVDAAKAALGEKLYFDTRLSIDGKISCSSCHQLHKGGTDNSKTSTGVGGQVGPINSPTVFNSENNLAQFWDGRAANLAEQAHGPVENPKEMGEQWSNVVKKLADVDDYVKSFAKIYGENAITKDNATDAIAEFERTLITPNSRFDKFLNGDATALTKQEITGWQNFQKIGCISCHSGTYLGGNSYQFMSEDYFSERGGEITEADLGRYNVTKDEDDKHMFKVPMLRNVAMTAPYFHDGTVKELSEAVRKMAKYQLGENLTDEETASITAFLKSTTGEYKGVALDKLQPEPLSDPKPIKDKGFIDKLLEFISSY